jgi:omega-6 fatty acid desaturase (delta-12 desaturase)
MRNSASVAVFSTRRFEHAQTSTSVLQLLNTAIPYLLGWSAIRWALHHSILLSVLLIFVTAGVYVRLFVLFHDCVHSSFFKSRRANEVVGCILGAITFTPYYQWRFDHLVHHNTSGNLDQRGIGDIKLLTVEEYLDFPPKRQKRYRLFRHPLILLGVVPLYFFLVRNRTVLRETANAKERWSVYGTNAFIALTAIVLSFYIGWRDYLIIQLSLLAIAAATGVWLFYIQHQYEGASWVRKENWNFVDSSLKGSSYYKLPKVLQWLTGNIGFHHVHHLNPRVPNYFLETCHNHCVDLYLTPPLTIRDSLKSLHYRLWDEDQEKFISFEELDSRKSGIGVETA